jgi:hypothetical protein
MPALQTARSELEKLVAAAVAELTAEQDQLRQTELDKWQATSDWAELNADDSAWIIAEVDKLAKTAPPTLAGFRQLLSHDYDLTKRLQALAREVANRAAAERAKRAKAAEGEEGEPYTEVPVVFPKTISKLEEIEVLIKILQGHRDQMAAGKRIRVSLKTIGESKDPTYS